MHPAQQCSRWEKAAAGCFFFAAVFLGTIIQRHERKIHRGEHTENQKPFGDRAAIQTFAPLLCSDNADLYAEYYEWLDQATQAQDAYLSGRLSEEDALKAIRKS